MVRRVDIEGIPDSQGGRPLVTLRVDVEEWPRVARDAAEALMSLRRGTQAHLDVAKLIALRAPLLGWIRTTLGMVPENARIFLVQDESLRLLDLASLLPMAFDSPRLHWGITPVFDVARSQEIIMRALDRVDFDPANVTISNTVDAGDGDPDADDLHMALALAKAAGVRVVRAGSAVMVRRHLYEARGDRAVHVLIAHGPRPGTISVGDVIMPLPWNSVRSWSHLPLELDLQICHGASADVGLGHDLVLLSEGTIWIHELANIHCELWSSTFRREAGFPPYEHSGLSYTEAMIQARAIVDARCRQGRDLVLELWDDVLDDE